MSRLKPSDSSPRLTSILSKWGFLLRLVLLGPLILNYDIFEKVYLDFVNKHAWESYAEYMDKELSYNETLKTPECIFKI